MSYKTRAVLEIENGELRRTLEVIYDRAAGALGAEDDEDDEDQLDDAGDEEDEP